MYLSSDGIRGEPPAHAAERFIEVLEVPGADLRLWRHFFTPSESNAYFEDLLHKVPWQQHRIILFGKTVCSPRLSAWYGDQGVTYEYSGITLVAEGWIPALQRIREQLHRVTGIRFNSVLLNLYRNEADSMGWHSDDETSLGREPVIASVSFGATRQFRLQHKHHKALRLDTDLSHGSLLLMAGATQHHWRHQVPKSKTPVSPRINLTFRTIKEHAAE